MSEEPGSDPIGDLQRWLMRAGARSVTREVSDRVKTTIGNATGSAKKNADVWDTATTEDPTDEPPECQWCPICRAARKARDGAGSSAGLSGQFAGAADALAGLTRDAFSLFETALRTPPPGTPRPTRSTPTKSTQPGSTPTTPTTPATPSAPETPATPETPSSDNGTVVGPGVGWPTVVHPKYEHDETPHEGGDREERGEPGDGSPEGGTDQQVEGTAE